MSITQMGIEHQFSCLFTQSVSIVKVELTSHTKNEKNTILILLNFFSWKHIECHVIHKANER